MSLVEALKDDATLRAVVKDGAQLIEDEIKGKRGLRAAALKTGYKSVKAIAPGIIEEALGHLLPEFAPVVDPFYLKAKDSGDVHGYFGRHAGAIADAMLGVTDARAERAKQRVMKRVYFSLRRQAKKHTEAAVPRLARLIDAHVK